jgi:hypothetical protein
MAKESVAPTVLLEKIRNRAGWKLTSILRTYRNPHIPGIIVKLLRPGMGFQWLKITKGIPADFSVGGLVGIGQIQKQITNEQGRTFTFVEVPLVDVVGSTETWERFE